MAPAEEGDIRLSALLAPVFYPAHRDLRRGGHSEYWFMGGRGSAKSSFASVEVLLGLMRDPEANAMAYRKVAATLRESVLEQLLWAADQLGVGAYFKPRLSPMELIYLPTGQRVLLRGADDPGKSKSVKLAKGYFKYLWFEELTEFSGMEDIRTIKASVIRGGPSGGRAYTLCTYNPPRSMNNWVNREALLPREDRYLHRSAYTDLPPAWLGESFISEALRLRDSDDMAYRHMYLGEITGTGSQVFCNLALGPIPPEALKKQDRFLCGLDFGFAADPDAFIRLTHDPRTGKILVTDEFYAVRAPIDTLARAVRALAGGDVVRCDSADPRMISELRERGVNAVGARKGPGSVEHGIRWLQERSAISIDPARCPNAAREFSSYEYGADGFGGLRSLPPDKNNHLIDAMRYAVEDVSRVGRARTVSREKMGI